MEIVESAHKHGIDDEDVRHATTTGLLRTIEQEYDGEVRTSLLEPTGQAGSLR